MAKRTSQKKAKKTTPKTDQRPLLRPEVKRHILAVALLLLGLFFLLAALGAAGSLGESIHAFMRNTFGLGFAVIPLALLAASFLTFKASRYDFSKWRVVAFVVGVIALLTTFGAFTNLQLERSPGGVVGYFLAKPLLAQFDVLLTVIITVAIALVAGMIAFDLHLKAPKKLLTGRLTKSSDDEYTIVTTEEEEDFDEQEDEEEPEANNGMGKVAISENTDQDAPDRTPKKALLKRKATETQESPVVIQPEEVDLETFAAPSNYKYPPMNILSKTKGRPAVGDIKESANLIKRTLQNFKINVEVDEISIGPTVTRFAIKPAQGVKLSRIVSLQNDLALALAAHPLRIEAPIPGKSLVGIEIPNKTKITLGLGSLLQDKIVKESKKSLLVPLGKQVSGETTTADLAKMPHLLIAGATGSGKSVTVHVILISLLYRNSPQDLKLLMVDPKRVELTLYDGIPHLLSPVIKDPKKAIAALRWAGKEMERRYDLLEKYKVRDIASYHKNVYHKAKADPDAWAKEHYTLETVYDPDTETETQVKKPVIPENMPYIVVVIDELADIMQMYPKELEAGIVRLAQMSRAVGIHLILSTQRPEVNVITGLIKANIPGRIALRVASSIDSRTILDGTGAEKLLGAGDMLYRGGNMSQGLRMQCPYISEEEVKKVVKAIKRNHEEELYEHIDLQGAMNDSSAVFSASFSDAGDDEDDLFEDAKQTVIKAGKASTSYLQRKLRVGYSRAARLIDLLEERGVIGPANGSKPRQVLEKPADAEE